jgi:hypothetical protein
MKAFVKDIASDLAKFVMAHAKPLLFEPALANCEKPIVSKLAPSLYH